MPGTAGPKVPLPTPPSSAAELSHTLPATPDANAADPRPAPSSPPEGGSIDAREGAMTSPGPSRLEPARPAYRSPSPPPVASMVAPFQQWDPSRWPGTTPQQPVIHQPLDLSSPPPTGAAAMPHEKARSLAAAAPRPTSAPSARRGAGIAAPYPGVPSGQPRPSFAQFSMPTRAEVKLEEQLEQLEREPPRASYEVAQASHSASPRPTRPYSASPRSPLGGSPRRHLMSPRVSPAATAAAAEAARATSPSPSPSPRKPPWNAPVRTIVPTGEPLLHSMPVNEPESSAATSEAGRAAASPRDTSKGCRAHSPTFDSPPMAPNALGVGNAAPNALGVGNVAPGPLAHGGPGGSHSPPPRARNGPIASESHAWSIAAEPAYFHQRVARTTWQSPAGRSPRALNAKGGSPRSGKMVRAPPSPASAQRSPLAGKAVAQLFRVGQAEVRTKMAAATALSDVALGRSFPSPASLGFEIDVDYRMRLRLGSGHHAPPRDPPPHKIKAVSGMDKRGRQSGLIAEPHRKAPAHRPLPHQPGWVGTDGMDARFVKHVVFDGLPPSSDPGAYRGGHEGMNNTHNFSRVARGGSHGQPFFEFQDEETEQLLGAQYVKIS